MKSRLIGAVRYKDYRSSQALHGHPSLVCRMLPVIPTLAFLAAFPTVCGAVGLPLTLLFQNSLNWTQSAISHPGLLLSSTPTTLISAQDVCDSLSENLVDISDSSEAVRADYQQLLDFQIYLGALSENDLLWVGQPASQWVEQPAPQSVGDLILQCTALEAKSLALVSTSCSAELPVLCTNSAPYSNSTVNDTSSSWWLSVESLNRTFTG